MATDNHNDESILVCIHGFYHLPCLMLLGLHGLHGLAHSALAGELSIESQLYTVTQTHSQEYLKRVSCEITRVSQKEYLSTISICITLPSLSPLPSTLEGDQHNLYL